MDDGVMNPDKISKWVGRKPARIGEVCSECALFAKYARHLEKNEVLYRKQIKYLAKACNYDLFEEKP